MRVHLLQLDLAWENKQANFAAVTTALACAKPDPGDLVLLPEMFDTAFSFNLERTADTDNQTADFLTHLAATHRVTVHGSRTVLHPQTNRGLNQALIIAPDGSTLATYNKLHPFSFGKESERFSPGDHITTYPWPNQGDRDNTLIVCPAICYDLRFPELFRAGLDLGAHAYALGANWPAPRAAHWRALIIARAIENQAFVFAVNRTGSDISLNYAGGSIVVDPKGTVLIELDDTPQTASVKIEPDILHRWRETFPAIRDRSPLLTAQTAPNEPLAPKP